MPTDYYRRTAMAAAIAACFPGAVLAAGVARVDFASGNVSAISPDGRSRALAKGAEIDVGETVATGQGRAQLRFADGAYMSLQPQTEFKVEAFKYSGRNEPSDGIVMNLLKGGLRTITGLLGRTNRNAYRLKTEVATIGIRGTEYSVRYTNSIEVYVADGAVSVENESGTFVVPGGTGVLVSNQNTPPQQTDQKPVLPPETPVDQEQEEQTQQPQDPVNPIQEAFPPVTQTILTGSIEANWAASHWFTGPRADFNRPVTLDGSGALVSFFADLPEFGPFTFGTATVGTATAQSSGNDGIIAWGRWVGGTTGGDQVGQEYGSFSGLDLTAFEGTAHPLHYVVGLPATNIPTSGTATYSMIGATPPSVTGFITSASVNSSSIEVDFASSSALFHLSMEINGSTSTTGTGVPIMRDGAKLSGSSQMTMTDGVFGGACGAQLTLSGFLAGNGASRAGMAYEIWGCCSGGVSGAIAYIKK